MTDPWDTDTLLRELEADVATHASLGEKFTGGAGDLATAAWIERELAAAGFGVAAEDIHLPCFEAGQVSLAGGGQDFDVIPQEPVHPTPETGITAPLAVLHDPAQAEAARGRIAVLVLPHARHSTIWLPRVSAMIEAAEAAGALALVILPVGPSGEIVALNAPVDPASTGVPMLIGRPAELGRYHALAASGAACRLVLTGRRREKRTPNIVARLDRGGPWIAVSTPRTGFFTCATERGTGTAAFLALARRLPRQFPGHSLFFVNTTGHEMIFAGTHAALAHAPDPDRTSVWAHIGATLSAHDQSEMRADAAISGVDVSRLTMATETMRDAVAEGFAGLVNLDRPGRVLSKAGELSTIVDLGYPNAFALLGQSRWFHTRQDVADKVNVPELARVTRAHAATIAGAVALHRVGATDRKDPR